MRARLVVAAVAMGLAACSGDPVACRPQPSDPGCPDLRFSGRYYDEWRPFRPEPPLQEQGDASYPACNDAETCGPDLGGFGATDVWLLDGVDIDDAVLGYRQDTETHVIFVRRGLAPRDVPGLARYAAGSRPRSAPP